MIGCQKNMRNVVGLDAITKESCATAHNTEDKREKMQALSLAKECYSMKLELLTNATVVDDAIRFVSHKSKNKDNIRSPSAKKEESNEPEYDKEEEQVEKEQEEQTGKITAATTTNQVF